MDLINLEEGESIVLDHRQCGDRVLRVVVTEATTDIVLACLYRMFTENAFGADQPVFVSLYEPEAEAMFLESVAIRLTSFSPNLLDGVAYSHDPSVAFKDADVMLSIGKARGYEFCEEEYDESFFKEYVLTAKFYGECIEKYAKKDVRIIVLGNTAATIISLYAKSVSPKNITSCAIFNLKMATAYIAAEANCLPSEIKNLIIWGANSNHTFPDCRYLSFTKPEVMTDSLEVWLRNDLPRKLEMMNNRSWYTRSLAYALAEHCEFLWNGTPKDEWTCMAVASDNSYGIRPGIFFSYPVKCKDKQYEIVKGLVDDEYTKERIMELYKPIKKEVRAALKICGLK